MYCTARCSIVVRECATKTEFRSIRWEEWGADKRKTKVLSTGAKSYHFISQAGIGLAATAHSAQGVEHARAEEAYKRDHAQLDARRGIPAR